MIYFLVGNDLKNKNEYIRKISGTSEYIFLTENEVSRELLINYSLGVSLFSEKSIIITDNLITKSGISLSSDDFLIFKESPTVFIFLEDKLLVAEERKFKKYAIIEKFVNKEIKTISNNDIFKIADSFAEQNKIKAWILYSQTIEKGISPESIAGILFWKIKTMILNGNKIFPLNILKKQSSKIVSLHHQAHRGETDFIIGLEQFILSSLSK